MTGPEGAFSHEWRPILFGEVLFDEFPDGSTVLGGAPLNVAWHLQAFGLRPLLISRVGDDQRAMQLLDAMTAWGLDTSGIQRDDSHPTGTVRVSLDRGQPAFDILAHQAYDFIDAAAALAAARAASPALLYHGTLGMRAATARAALLALRDRPHTSCFVDVNLRPPWSTMEIVGAALRGVSRAKLNHHELQQIAAHERLRHTGLDDMADAVRRRFGVHTLVVTCGEHGAFFVGPTGRETGVAVEAQQIVDTVGAGDAFSAVTMLGLMKHWPTATILRRAMAFAAAICGIRGAISADRGLYQYHLRQWSGAMEARA